MPLRDGARHRERDLSRQWERRSPKLSTVSLEGWNIHQCNKPKHQWKHEEPILDESGFVSYNIRFSRWPGGSRLLRQRGRICRRHRAGIHCEGVPSGAVVVTGGGGEHWSPAVLLCDVKQPLPQHAGDAGDETYVLDPLKHLCSGDRTLPRSRRGSLPSKRSRTRSGKLLRHRGGFHAEQLPTSPQDYLLAPLTKASVQ
jgi:hypothetical protein